METLLEKGGVENADVEPEKKTVVVKITVEEILPEKQQNLMAENSAVMKNAADIMEGLPPVLKNIYDSMMP